MVMWRTLDRCPHPSIVCCHFISLAPMTAARLPLLIASLLLGCALPAQQRPQWGVGLHTSGSHSGWNQHLVGHCQAGRLGAYLGPGISLNRGLPPGGPVSINAGAEYLPAQSLDAKLRFLVGLDYMVGFWQSQGSADLAHEVNAGLCLMWHPTAHWRLGIALGQGLHLESYYNEFARRREQTFGYGSLLRVRMGYAF